jgi:hypothetical protein
MIRSKSAIPRNNFEKKSVQTNLFSRSRSLSIAFALFVISPCLYLLSGDGYRRVNLLSRGRRIPFSKIPYNSDSLIRPTRQLCFEHADESEYCIYDGPLCYDGTDLIVVVDDDNQVKNKGSSSSSSSSLDFNRNEMTRGDGFFNERGDQCIDWRLVETKDSCYYHERADRSAPPASVYCSGYVTESKNGGYKTGKEGKEYASACAESTITTPVRTRLWGPDGRMLRIREYPLSHFQDITSQSSSKSSSSSTTTTIGLTRDINHSSLIDGFTHFYNIPIKNAFVDLYSDTIGSVKPVYDDISSHSSIPSIDSSKSTSIEDISNMNSSSAYWLDGPLYVIGSDERWLEHLWHGASVMFPLFAVKRQNGTAIHIPRSAAGVPPWPRDRVKQHSLREDPLDERHVGIHSSSLFSEKGEEDEDTDFLQNNTNTREFFIPSSHGYRLTRGGPGVPLPPMDYVLVTDKGTDRLEKWMAGLWPLLSQKQTSLLFPDRLEKEFGKLSSKTISQATLNTPSSLPSFPLGSNKWICASRAVFTGIQPRLFTGIGDANAFRLHAWALAGIDVKKQHTHYPPRKIVVLAREFTRELKPQTPMYSLLKATGLMVHWEHKPGRLSFEEQVKLTASAGIIIGAHGAALTNIMFAPSHSVVIEMTPHLLNWPLYRKLADVSNLFYYRVPADIVPKERMRSDSLFLEGDFREFCEDPQRVSSIDASSLMACNGRSKNSNINIDFEAFLFTLVSALDDIGCRPRQFSRDDSRILYQAQEDVHDSTLTNSDKIVIIEKAKAFANTLGVTSGFLDYETDEESNVKLSSSHPSLFFVQPIRNGRIFNIATKCSGDESYFADKIPTR